MSFLDHAGVLGRISIPLLIPPTPAVQAVARTPRVPMFKYPIPSHSLEAWKTQVSLHSHPSISLAIATANAILDNLRDNPHNTTPVPSPHHQLGSTESILSLADDLQNILGEAMDLAKSMLPLKATAPNKGQTLP